MAHNYGSFDYKVVNDAVKNALEARSNVDNTVQISMPFVRATTTLLLDQILGKGNIGFTLGVHGIATDVLHDDMFGYRENGPLVGYSYKEDGSPHLIYAFNMTEGVAAASKLFDRNGELVTTDSQYKYIPPPGITSCKIGRNKNGLLVSADISFSVPSLIQLEFLHRTFLVPGIGMVLEWGQLFAQNFGGLNQTSISSEYLFPWQSGHEKLKRKLARLGANNIGLEEILRCHTYPTDGQYMWMFGRVANFKVNSNGDGSFECSVKIVGPSEDSWAYSTRNTVVPLKDSSGRICANGITDISTYFKSTVVNGFNFKTLLDAMTDSNNGKPVDARFDKVKGWSRHVIKYSQGNQLKNPEKEDEKAKLDPAQFSDSEDAYFISWRFFVNVVLNDPEVGIMGIFRRANLTPAELSRIAMLRPYQDAAGKNMETLEPIDDPYESYVGYHQWLRSIDPSVLVIANPDAIAWAASENRGPKINESYSETPSYAQAKTGLPSPSQQTSPAQVDAGYTSKFLTPSFIFPNSTNAVLPEEQETQAAPSNDRGLLSTGIWLNHKAVCLSMIGADTLLRGVITLLEKMNAATMNFWQLSVDPSDSTPLNITCGDEGIEINAQTGFPTDRFQYIVTDINYRENSDSAVNKFIDKVHIFNKYIRKNASTGNVVGSELIDCSVDLSLPKRLFSQIATLGLVQPGDLRNAGIVESPQDTTSMVSPLIADPNEALRQMFAITSLAVQNEFDQGPDLTIPSVADRKLLQAANVGCGGGAYQAPANTQGNSLHVTPIYNSEQFQKLRSALEVADSEEALNKFLGKTGYFDSDLEDALEGCSECKPSLETLNSVQKEFESIRLSQLTVGQIQFLQNGKQIYAVGKYQVIPRTFNAWVASQNISPSAVFDDKTQELLGEYLLTQKRPKIGQFIKGSTSITPIEAQLELAKEFASVPVAAQVDRPATKNWPAATIQPGQSYYYGVAGNNAQDSVAKYQTALLQARQQKSFIPLKNAIIRGEGNIDSINRGVAGDTAIGSPQYAAALRGYALIPSAPTKEALEKLSPKCQQCYYAEQLKAQAEQKLAVAQQATNKQSNIQNDRDRLAREFPGLGGVWPLIEYQGEYMVAAIANDANGKSSNPFGASPGTLSIAADLKLPGISGFRVGELFWIDRVPAFYKAFGAFQIMSIEDSIDSNGWVTSIHARFNYLGNAWKKRMSVLLSTSLKDLKGDTAPKG